MRQPLVRSHRYVLHPDKSWEDVSDFADGLGWPLVYQQSRDRSGGVDGQMIWQSDAEVSVHYVVDATSGIGYVTLAGPDSESFTPYIAQAEETLVPWQLQELYQRFDSETDVAERGRLILRIGLAAPSEPAEGCTLRIHQALADDDARIRLAGLWAASYTGYRHFAQRARDLSRTDPEPWIRARAESIEAAFSALPQP